MNHACEPTLLPEEVVQLRGYFRIVFIARRHIYPGEELTFDYSAPFCTPCSIGSALGPNPMRLSTCAEQGYRHITELSSGSCPSSLYETSKPHASEVHRASQDG